MRNLWVQVEEPFAVWIADIAPLIASQERLLDVVDVILTAGARHRVFELEAAPVVGYERARDGDLRGVLRQRWTESLSVDAFAFTGAAMAPDHPLSSRVTAQMAFHDRADALVEQPVADLGAILRALERVPDSISPGFTSSYPPVRITGPRLAYARRAGGYVLPRVPVEPVIKVELQSDIWFPFVFGSSHPWADNRRMFDNRALASRHTPRLNAFLCEVGDAVVAAGGRWYVDEEETGSNAILWLDERGILVDAPEPELMPPEALDAEWW